MFEAHVLHLLRKYLGEYVHGLSSEALRISVWKGDVVLKDLRLKAEALNSLKLPVTVTAGFVGTITLKVPWKSLGKEPVIVLIDRVFVLAHPAPDGLSLKDEDRERLFEAKLRQIEEAELATLEATSRGSKSGNPPGGSSWLSSLIATIIGNLKITISNVHIRYEDSVSHPAHPFCSGITLAKLAAVTTDELGNETFDTSGALDKLRKSLNLQRLALYHDSDSTPWKLEKKWEELDPTEWVEIFADGINEADQDKNALLRAKHRKYLVSPINGVLKYHRFGKQEKHDQDIPLEKASLVLTDVSLTILESQYYDGIKLLETLSRFKTRVDVSHLRPVVPVSKHTYLWWRYAVQATLQQKKMCYRFSWERIKHLCYLRRCYVQLYATSLQACKKEDNYQIRQIERDLDSKVILLWRLLAHAKVESVKSKDLSQQSGGLKRSWFSFGWRTTTGDMSAPANPIGAQVGEEKLSKEEWQVLNKMLSYELDEESIPISGKVAQTMIQFLVDISVEKAAARIVSIDQTEVLCGRFEQLRVSTKLYHKSTHCEMSLRYCGLSSPEGSLAQSVSNEKKENALAATFVYSPIGDKVDWSLSATIAPCHVTVFMKSYERFLGFLKRSNAVSPTVALETATALQMKLEQVTRRAQEQFQTALEEQSRFSLDIDLDAPKVRIPFGDCSDDMAHGNFLLDFGHFTLHTRESEGDEQRESIYSRFTISGKDIAAFFSDGCYTDCTCFSMRNSQSSSSSSFSDNIFHSLIDRCRMSVVVDQLKVPHPSYPSTRISIEVPKLGMHFSPIRYRRIFDLLNLFYGSAEVGDQGDNSSLQPVLVPWYPADLASEARILVWRGIGNSLAEWRPCYLVLSRIHLYVLESGASQSYQRCCSMAGRYAFEVPSTSVGGSLCSVAVCLRGFDIQKALESSSTLIIEFQTEVEKISWLKGLMQATYCASAFPMVDLPGKFRTDIEDVPAPSNTFQKANLVINGSLVEAKLSVYGMLDRSTKCPKEELILDILAGGGKVYLVRTVGDLSYKMKLHFLKIRDELQGQKSTSSQYLACSVVKHNLHLSDVSASSCINEVLPKNVLEEDDIFRDALPDFGAANRYIDGSSNDTCDEVSGVVEECGLCTCSMFGDNVHCTSTKCWANFSGTEIFYEAEDDGSSDFVVLTFVTRHADSPLYDGVDTQMSICMSKLDFFCNRPTLVALLDFGFDLSLVNSSLSSTITNSNNSIALDPNAHGRDGAEDSGRTIVRGLLGCGKKRIVFYLKMVVDSVYVYLNKEDGSQFAMLVQEKFLFDFKVYPSSIALESTLGNFRLRDMSLGSDHCWSWLCDVRDQGNTSLIKFSFRSFSADDDDYEGYDYNLSGQLSAVRLVFLYRFVQEVMAYFMGLANPHTEEVIKFVDKVGGFEWLIKKYEIDGASSIKLDLSLDTPVIVVPYSSSSRSFMQFDLGKLQITNSFSWHGEEKDPSAVHLDIIHVEMCGINLAVALNGEIGDPMIKEGQELKIEVRRSLRDVFRKVPTASVEVKVSSLHCVMSDKEYSIIRDCAYTNISEVPCLPPSFRGSAIATKDSIRLLADKVNFNTQTLLSRTVVIMIVDIQHVLLELRNGRDEESPLAQIVLEGLWVYYRYTSLFESDLYVTIPKFSLLDIRPNVKPEMRLMLGSSSDAYKQGACSTQLGEAYSWTCNEVFSTSSEIRTDAVWPTLTMLIIDYRCRSSSQSFVIRMQQPRVLVVLDFLVVVAEFFVPSLRSMTGREESVDPRFDPLTKTEHIIVSKPLYMQRTDIICLSPARKLIVDGPGFDEAIYDGCGGTIRLGEDFELNDYGSPVHAKLASAIFIGRGKRVRFKNVKFENGSLLSKHTYLSNDSSYSVLTEDGVEIYMPEKFPTGICDDSLYTSQRLSHQRNTETINTEANTAEPQSFSFEAQVVSPEFTFYDSSCVFREDTMHVEKLLRAKMDFSFMYASKGNDLWVRSHVKDLCIESGSGLAVLDPLDISGGYTSVKDKTNISVISTDICIHLSLSVASLILRLQHQAFTELKFGNLDPVTYCTNFKRIWASQEGTKTGQNITFWRPQAPQNYAILGDCVTLRSVPPSQVVIAVSNSYGRIRKPIGFKLIAMMSNILTSGEVKEQTDVSSDCSIWIPIAPPGYIALGCIAHLGRDPPPNHVVYCLRSDLVTSATFSECIVSVPVNHRAYSGFSIWRVDNVVCSFYAHSSVDYPGKGNVFDLHNILIGDLGLFTHTSKSSFNGSDQHHDCGQLENVTNSNFSGWDVLRSFSKPTSCYISTPHFERIWWDKGGDFRRAISFWRPLPRLGFCALGDCLAEGLEPPTLGLLFKCDSSGISAKPTQFTKVGHVIRKGIDDAYFWYPVPPPGYASLGCVVTKLDEPPCKESFCCPRIDLVSQASIPEFPLSKSSSSKGSNCWSVWKIENQANTFLARADHKRPSSRLAYSISDYVKPKSRENISAEMKVGSLSLTILDGLCGMMTPFFDITITSINLATHGRFDSMNAVLICSVAASTFSRQLEAWEPLVEPFEGIFKVETYDTNENAMARVGKRIRVATTSILNLNLSAGNLETLTESVVSWRKQADLEQKAMRKREESVDCKTSDNLTFSALNEDDFEKVILENKLGCDLYLKKVVDSTETVVLLSHGNEAPVSIPPPRFADRMNVITGPRETRTYVVIKILYAKGLPVEDDGNGLNFFCALRLVIDGSASSRNKLFPQSARTRSVKPVISKIDDITVVTARWNEIFLFEVPDKMLATLELEITNLASKTGKGEVVGALSIPIRNNTHTLKRVGSIRMLLDMSASGQQSSYPLKRKGQSYSKIQNCGSLYASTTVFERSKIPTFQGGSIYSPVLSDKEAGFWVGLNSEGPWESFGSLLPLATSPKLFDEKPFAFEVTMKNGSKHAVFRPLALIINDADVELEVSLCSAPKLESAQNDLRTDNLVKEEIFENQKYHPTSGWGSKWTGPQSNEPATWSTRNFSYSSKDFFDISLPAGWRWTSAWNIEKTELVDCDGWAYGIDFQSLMWPPSSSKSRFKSPQDCVRRRRWVRSRQQLPKENIENARNVIAIISPGSSASLPWSSITMDAKQSLQIRPYNEHAGIPYDWGQMFSVISTYNSAGNENFAYQGPFSRQNTFSRSDSFRLSPSTLTLDQLGKTDFLLCCDSRVDRKQHFWLTVGTDATVLQTEVNVPLYDWKITINSPLRIENKLPYQAEFYIWQLTAEGHNLERQYGNVPSGNSFYMYSIDLRKPVYLTLSIGNDWVMEKDSVLIMNLSSSHHASSFWMVHKQSSRRLCVNVEHDIAGTIAKPKLIKLFVPYWIRNDSYVPLSYRIMELESFQNGDADSLSTSKAIKSTKSTLRHTYSSLSSSKRREQIFEVIEEPNSPYIMLSPQGYNYTRILHHESPNELSSTQYIGISVAACYSEFYGLAISLYELENKERVDIKAFASNEFYYKLSAVLSMTSERTKVVCFQPHGLFINRLGRSICLKQSDDSIEWLQPVDPPKPFKWQSGARTELLKLWVDGYNWSTSFSVRTEGLMCISLRKDENQELMHLWVEVQSGVKASRYEIIFRPAAFSSPYRIENRSLFLYILFRQIDSQDDFWRSLPPNSSTSFCWEDLGRRQLLEVVVKGTDTSKSENYNIDIVREYQPTQTCGGPMKAICVSVFKDGKGHVVRIDDWRPETGYLAAADGSSAPPRSSENDGSTISDSEFHMTLELAELGLSIIDHTPEEIMYVSVQSLLLSYSTGLGSGVSRIKMRIVGLQVDNQLPFTPMPVLFRSQRIGEEVDDYVLKFSLTLQSSSQDLCMYPFISIQGPENSAFLVNIHEPIIWRLHEMIKQARLGRMYSTQNAAVPIDPVVQIRLLNISEFRFKLSMSMSPNQRPGGVLGFWSSLMTALGNMENMTVRINQRSREDVCMRQSTLISNAISNIQKDLLSQPLRLLSGVDILGNASSALGHMSKGVAALSMDRKFIQSRQKQESKTVEDFGDVIREGGGALAKGLFRGVTGILTKPLEGAKSSGVEGFVQGVGKGIIGVAAQPVSGVLDLLSKTTEGANAVRMKIASAITSEEQLLRRRLPRVIGGDNLLKPYDEYKATGLAILQLAESGTFFGQADIFKVRGKFALSDAYEDHFLLPKGKLLLVTHRRALLLQQPTNIVGQRKFNPARDPCSVLWDVLWDDLMTMELAYGNKDPPTSPSRLILYPRIRSSESRETVHVIKCRKESQQASEVYISIQRALNTYGPNRLKETQRGNVRKPYSPSMNAESASVIGNEAASAQVIPDMPLSLSVTSSFGAI